MGQGVPCPECKASDSLIRNSRLGAGGAVNRTRVCQACGHHYFTRENIKGASTKREEVLERRIQLVTRAATGDLDHI